MAQNEAQPDWKADSGAAGLVTPSRDGNQAPEASEAGLGPVELPWRQRRSFAAVLGDFLQSVGVWLAQDAMPRMAAALAYRTIFSLIPLLVLSFLIFRLFPDSDTIVKNFLNQLLERSGLAKITADKDSAAEWIGTLVAGFKGINFGAIGVVSAAVLIYGALSLLVDIESSFNAVYGATRARSWTRRIIQYWFIVSIGPLFMYAGFLAGEKFNALATSSVRQVSAMVEQVQGHTSGEPLQPDQTALEPAPTEPAAGPSGGPAAPVDEKTPPANGEAQPGPMGPAGPGGASGAVTPEAPVAAPTDPGPRDGAVTALAIRATGYVVTVCISALLLLVLYLTVPNTTVRLLPALVGAFTGGLLLELAKTAFRSFFSAESYKSLYGGLALLPLFLMWIYIMWFIVLFGLRIAFLVQHGRTGVLLQAFRASTQGTLGGSWMEPARAVSVVVSIAESFQLGKTARPWQLAQEAGMDEQTARLLLSRLEEAGIVNRVASEGREQTFTLSRPADSISVAEIVAVGQALAGPVSPGPAGELIARVRAAQLQAVVDVPLGSLLVKKKPRTGGGGPVVTAAAAPAAALPPAGGSAGGQEPTPAVGGGVSAG